MYDPCQVYKKNKMKKHKNKYEMHLNYFLSM